MKLFFRTFCICAFVAYFFVVGSSASAVTFITTTTVWRLSDSPIVLNDSISIRPGIKLTIEPGVVIKFSSPYTYNRKIVNDGILEAIGTPDKPIIFTSIKDDSAGGDTNHDGAATGPQSGDWLSLTSNQGNYPNWASMALNNVIIRYGGNSYRNVIVNNFGKIEIKNSTITHNNLGLLNNYGSFKITNSSIYGNDRVNNIEYAFQNFGSVAVSAQNNWWGITDGPCAWRLFSNMPYPEQWLSLPQFCGQRPIIDNNVAYSPWLTQPPKPEANKRHPVIIIPGILGSWPDMKTGKLVLDPIIHTYDDLWYALIEAGYTTGTNLFDFPYEWRRSNVITAQLLKQKIADVKNACVPSDIFDCTKVDLIGHSMGGLVARQYIANSDYANDVDQLIFIATPHKGAPKAYAMWEGGYWGELIQDKFLAFIFRHESKKVTGISGDIGLVTYLQDYNIDSVRELLPIYPYIYDENLGQVRYYPDNYPTNPFLENLNSSENLNKLKSAVKVTNIIGNSIDTITSYSVVNSAKPLPMWADGMPRDFYSSKSGILIGNGDGTVPTVSNSSFLDLTPIVLKQDHGSAVSYAQSEVINELTGSRPVTEIHNDYGKTLLMITLQCPADIQIVAPDGKRLGSDIYSSTTLAEIPGGYYYYSDDSLLPEYAIIPNPIDGQYQVKVVGTNNGGAYTIDTNYISDTTSTESQYLGVILPGREQVLDFNFSSSSLSSSEIKSDITIDTAMADVEILHDSQLITAENSKNKIIQQYGLLKLKVGILDKLAVIADHEVDKWHLNRHEEIVGILSGINEKLMDLLASGVLKQLGYDIIKSNNDYLINNW